MGRLALARVAVSGARGAIVVAILGLVGCAVGPDFSPPAEPGSRSYLAQSAPLPSGGDADPSQRLQIGAAVKQGWWRLFRSSELDRTLTAALSGSPTIEAAQARLRQARENAIAAAGALYPQIDLNLSATRARPSQATPPSSNPGGILTPTSLSTGGLPSGLTSTNTIANYYSVGSLVSFDPDLFGRNRRILEQQGALSDAQLYQLAAVYVTLTGNIVTQAIQIATIREQIKTLESVIALDERNLELVNRSVQVGKAAQTELLSAKAQLANDRAFVPPIRQQLDAAEHGLSLLVGASAGDWSPPKFTFAKLSLPMRLPVTLPSALVHARPDILTAEAQLHAASAAIGVATAQLYPDLTLSGSLARQAYDISSLGSPTSAAWSIAAGLAAPIFHGGTLQAQKRAAMEAYAAQLATYRQTVLQAFSQVADVLSAIRHDAELLAFEKQALDAADASLKTVQQAYSLGQANFLQVLDAQRLYEQAVIGYVRAKGQRFFDTAQLFAALGGDWQASDLFAQSECEWWRHTPPIPLSCTAVSSTSEVGDSAGL